MEGEDNIFDYNHRLAQMFDAIGPWIRHLHVHDVQPIGLRDHRGVGRGIIDFASVIRHLRALNFDGVLLLELAEPDFAVAAQESVIHLAQLMAALSQPQPEDIQ